jgi:hypothetical protein
MKKFLLLFALLFIFKSANGQLEFYEFMLNIYDNGERITDTRKFSVTINTFDRQKPGEVLDSYTIFPGDTSKNMGYDYHLMVSGDLFFQRTAEIIIAQFNDTMKIILDDPKASAWTVLGMDKVEFKKGIFKITENEWPKNRRDKPEHNRYFPYLDENFDWEKIRQ